MCFSKGLGAPIGSIIVCSEELHHRALWVRKSMGGGTRQLGVLTAAARVAVEDTFFGGKLLPTHQKAKRVASIWTKYGGKVTAPVETNMVWVDLEEAGITAEEFAEAGRRIGIKLLDGRLVIHYQICEEALEGFQKLARKVLAGEGEDEACRRLEN
ncbi:hypothetical protein PRZ48_012864 [Zasmidium cellare]|uniref:Aromatic amino acid beta-eliminating lyase/threonine aldolase domain-containing protein n=1 Tax=Zasmidium cellare TaxID=395010 RepID=A0ABR0E308_ZASCE|nr:hypothetical protein PRZ48_012864 [Zasmidium cellare]